MPRGIAVTSVGSALFALSLLYFGTDAPIAYGWTLVLSLATLDLPPKN